MKTIAIIPARGGSKRIPEKNIQLFGGLQLLKFLEGPMPRIVISPELNSAENRMLGMNFIIN